VSLAFLLVLSGAIPAPTSTAPAAVVSRAELAVIEFSREHQVVGMSVAVMDKGKLVFDYQTGFADREREERVQPETRFRLASISKPITAVGAMRLAERGKLDLDADSRRYVPEWPANTAPVSVAQLLSHTGGFRHYAGGINPDGRTHFATAREANAVLIKSPLLWEPNTRYMYSTHAFTVVARAMETASGRDFVSYMRREVFTPAGGELDVEDQSLATPRNRIYEQNGLGVPRLNTFRDDLSWKYGGGGMESTARGLARWGEAVRSGKLVTPASLKLMGTPRTLKNGTQTEYGLGWDLGEANVLQHGGSQPGARTHLMIDLAKERVVVVLGNTTGSYNPAALGRTLNALDW